MRLDLSADADLPALVRAAEGVSAVTLVVAPGRDPVARATMRAAIAPLAIELAPATRLNAVLPEIGAAPEDVAAMVAFLEQAASTTGQLIELSARPFPADARMAPAPR